MRSLSGLKFPGVSKVKHIHPNKMWRQWSLQVSEKSRQVSLFLAWLIHIFVYLENISISFMSRVTDFRVQ